MRGLGSWPPTVGVLIAWIALWAMLVDLRFRYRRRARWWFAPATSALLIVFPSAAGFGPAGSWPGALAFSSITLSMLSAIAYFLTPAEPHTPTVRRDRTKMDPSRPRGHGDEVALDRLGRHEQAGAADLTLVDAMIGERESPSGCVATDPSEASLTLVDEVVDRSTIERGEC